MAMIRAASELTRDLVNPNARIYWVDFLGSAFIGYAGVAAAILAPSTAWMLAAALIAVVALYRAGSFIHELTHIRKNALPVSGWCGICSSVSRCLSLPSFTKASTAFTTTAPNMARSKIPNICRWR